MIDPSTEAHSYETNHSAQLHKVCKALLNGMLAVKDWMSISKLNYLLKQKAELKSDPCLVKCFRCDMWGWNRGMSGKPSEHWPAQVAPQGSLVQARTALPGGDGSEPAAGQKSGKNASSWKVWLGDIPSLKVSVPSGHSQVSYHTTNARRNSLPLSSVSRR